MLNMNNEEVKRGLTTRGKILIGIILIAIIGGLLWQFLPDEKTAAKNAEQTEKLKIPDVAKSGDVAFDKAFTWKVGVNTWVYPGLAYAAGGFEPNPNSLFWTKYHTKVQLVWTDDPNAVRNAWKSDEIHMYWQTLDAFTTEVQQMLDDYDAKITFIVDKSRGGDVCVATAEIKKVSDLIGKRIAMATGVPSHTLFLNMLEAASIPASKVNYGVGVDPNKINVVQVPSALEAVTYYKNGITPAAVIWAPDDEDCLKEVVGSHILWSTAKSREAIADVLPIKKSVLDAHMTEYVAFLSGLLEGNAIVASNPAVMEKAIGYLATGFNSNVDFFRAIANKARFATYGDNVQYFLDNSYQGMTAQRLYYNSGKLYAAAGFAPTVLPDWRRVVDTRALKQVKLTGAIHAAEGEYTFAPATAEESQAPAIATKVVTVNFAFNSAQLDDVAKMVIDREFLPIARANTGFRVRIEGNTDNVGSDDYNVKLSYQRARAVRDYLVGKLNCSTNQWIIRGNGPFNPLPGNINANESERQANRRTEFQLLQ